VDERTKKELDQQIPRRRGQRIVAEQNFFGLHCSLILNKRKIVSCIIPLGFLALCFVMINRA